MCQTGLRTGAEAAGAGRLGVGELRELRLRGGHLRPRHSGKPLNRHGKKTASISIKEKKMHPFQQIVIIIII